MSETSERIEQELQALLAPVKSIDAELATREAHVLNELEEVRAERRRLKKVIEGIEGPPPAKLGPKPKRTIPEHALPKISEERIAVVGVAVAELEGEWTTSALKEKLPGIGQDQIAKALGHLRERGQIRLVKVQRGKGPGSIYRTTPRGAPTLVEVGNFNGSSE